MRARHRRSFSTAGLVLLGVASVVVGCSGKTTTQGEIVVAIQTDLSLPKDVSAVRIQVSSLGVVGFDNTYPVGPDPSMRIPATIGLLPGETPDAPIRIRVVGFKGEYKPRILREVVTTVPPSRVVSLRMPLQWLSDGSAILDPLSSGDPNAFVNTCDEGKTNIGGLCEDSHLDSATLPDYVPADVFGGGDETGAGGTCFDTQKCMQGRADAQATSQADGSCTMPAPPGDPAQRNVAFELPSGGDGICADASGGGPCFVPIDQVDAASDGLGWYVAPDGEIRLPAGVCAKLGAKGFTGHLVTSSGACASKTPKIPTCGPWSSVQGGTSGGGAVDAGAKDGAVDAGDGSSDASNLLPPQKLSQGEPGASALVLDNAASTGNVLWTIAGAGIRSVQKSGGSAQTLFPASAPTSHVAFHVAHDPAGLWNPSEVGTDTTAGIVWMYGADGGISPAMTGLTNPGGIAVVSSKIVYATGTGVHTCDLGNCAATDLDVTYLAGSPTHPVDVAGNDVQGVYVATNSDAAIYECSAVGCDMFLTAATNPGGIGTNAAIVTTSDTIYWIDEGPKGHVYASPYFGPDGGAPTPVTLATGYDTSAVTTDVHRGIAVDATWVYFTAGTGVFAVPIGGGTVVPLAAGLSQPAAIAVDSGYVYWSDFGQQTINRTPKPAALP